MVSKLEYSYRSELWFICLSRGVIVDMPKTDSAPRCSPPRDPAQTTPVRRLVQALTRSLYRWSLALA